MARVIALSGDHLKKINNNYSNKLSTFKESLKETASAAVELGKEMGVTLDNVMSNAALGVYETGQELKDIITGNAYQGAHTLQSVANQPVAQSEPIIEQTNREMLSQVESSNVLPSEGGNVDEEIVSFKVDDSFLNDNSLFKQAVVQLEAAKLRWDQAAALLDFALNVSKQKNLPDSTRNDINEFIELQRNKLRKQYDEYLVEEARLDVLKERILRNMYQYVDSKAKQNDNELTSNLGSEVGGMNTEIVNVQPMENVQNGIRF